MYKRQFIRLFGRSAIAFGAMLATKMKAQAEAPYRFDQSPAFYRIKLGDFEVTAIHDGSLQFDPRQLLRDETGELSSALNETLVDPHVVTISVSGFLVNTGKQLILVDAGTGGWWGGPTLGKLLVNLRAAGYKPEEVDTVLLTHLHPDHVGGITTLSGASVFSNADVRMSQIESDFWLSAKVAAKATENERGFFKIARAVSTPYLASGRWRPFTPSDRLSDGIEVVPLPGHTPGQVGYEFTSVGQRLFIMGDVVHVAEVQFKHPEIGVAFDEDQKTAVGQRERLLKRLVAQNILLAGPHLPFPTFGRIRKDGDRGYAWVPVSYADTPFLK
jgi:glyoxylase-like metal-dependent hydrolase (beta-lactamase superfamily II)